MEELKKLVGVLGNLLFCLSILLIGLIGFSLMNEYWGLAGVVIGVFFFPIPLIIGTFVTCFTTVPGFLGSLIWFSLLGFMISCEEN